MTNGKKKQPIDMTSDELLDYSLAPEVAERVKRIANLTTKNEHCERKLNTLKSTSMIRCTCG